MKDGEVPALSDISFEKLDIPERYWISVFKNLIADGYLRGIEFRDGTGKQIFIVENDPQITISGIEFLQENTAMNKAKAFLKELKEIIPGL